MNLSGYLVLAVTAVSVVLAQQSNTGAESSENDTISIIKESSKENEDAKVFPNATLFLKNGYINGTHIVAESKEIIMEGIAKAKKLALQNPKAVKNSLLKSFTKARSILFNYGIPTVLSVGEALVLSNEAARQGLKKAMTLLEKGGVDSIDVLNSAESFFIQGVDSGDNAIEGLLDAVSLTLKTGFAVIFRNIQESILEAQKALRDAQRRPMQGQVENVNCKPAPRDSEGSNAIDYINKAAENALKRGANADLVQKLRKVFNCSVVAFVNIASNGLANAQQLKTVAAIDPFAAEVIFFKIAHAIEKETIDEAANIYLVFGDVVLHTGNRLSKELQSAILAIENGQGVILETTKAAKDLIAVGLDYQGDIPKFTFEAIAKMGSYAKTFFIQAIVKCAELVFSAM